MRVTFCPPCSIANGVQFVSLSFWTSDNSCAATSSAGNFISSAVTEGTLSEPTIPSVFGRFDASSSPKLNENPVFELSVVADGTDSPSSTEKLNVNAAISISHLDRDNR